MGEAAASSSTLILLSLVIVSVPLALVLMAGNAALNIIRHENNEIPPTRWLASTLIPMLFASYGYMRKNINTSGAVFGLLVGILLTLTNYSFLVCLMTFFLTSSKATRFRSAQKRKIEKDFKEGGQRNWVQVLCNSGVASALALLYLIEIGVGETPIDFSRNYRASWLSLGVMGAFAAANADTWASELGSVLSSTDPVLITTFKTVPRGVNGGVSFHGTVVSFVGGLTIGLCFYLSLLVTIDSKILSESPPQWPVLPISGLIGLLGSFIDSFLGATLQYSGVDKKTGAVVEQPSANVKYISGRCVLDNHGVNLLSNIIAALITPGIANVLWPLF